MIKTELQLKQDIEDELHWDPMINAAAEGAKSRVNGVHSIALDPMVKLGQAP